MTYLVTGSSGFVGRYIWEELTKKGQCLSLGRGPGVDILCDLGVQVPDFSGRSMDIIIHNAGKAHLIPKTEVEKKSFFEINQKGTHNLLQGIQQLSRPPKLIVYISTVAVYGRETGRDIDESHPLNGNTPYALSKIKAEQCVLDWGTKNKTAVVVLRLPLVIGLNQPQGNLKSLILGIKSGYYFRPGSGKAKKSMIWAEDLAILIASLSEKHQGIYNLTDKVNPALNELDSALAAKWGKTIWEVPEVILKVIAKIGDYVPFIPFQTTQLDKLTMDLTFSSKKAEKELQWKPRPVIERIKEFSGKLD